MDLSSGTLHRTRSPSPRPSTTGSSSTHGIATLKRQRLPASRHADQDDGDDDHTGSAFYLRQQNKALATELRTLQALTRTLTVERDHRRRICHQAVQALDSLQATWTQLETSLRINVTGTTVSTHPNGWQTALSTPSLTASGDAPPSTLPLPQHPGAEEERSPILSVEWTKALTQALTSLGTTPSAVDTFQASGDDWSTVATNVAARAAVLQEAILQKQQSRDDSGTPSLSLATAPPEFVHELERYRAQTQTLQAQIAELADARERVTIRERQTRRDIYRLASGLLTSAQLVARFDSTDQAVDDDLDLAALQASVRAETRPASPPPPTPTDAPSTGISDAQMAALQAQLQDARQQVAARETSLQELTTKWQDAELRVNALSTKQLTETDTRQLESLASTLEKYRVVESESRSLEAQIVRLRSEWAQARGNDEAARQSMEDLQSKHRKRWAELASLLATGAPTNEDVKSPEVADPIAEADFETLRDILTGSRTIVELRHKLNQALGHVRQVETVRDNLRDALVMNETLKQKVDEYRAKANAAIASQATKSPPSSRHGEAGISSAAKEKESEKPATEKPSSSSSNHDKSDKMHREFRRMRKDLATLTTSKDAAKAKLERSEREKETLLDANSRFLQQIAEKDEMNAKSLSTILHLKQMTEQLSSERDILEQQVKGASQLALAARLATNAKERVSEELVKERLTLDKRVNELEIQLALLNKDLAQKTVECSEATGRMSITKAELEKVLARNNELVEEAEKRETDIRGLVDSANKAEREAREAKGKLDNLTQQSGGDLSAASSSSTVNQLNTQISVLKSRLACPVCHYRDKECIIMRCRHMHCKQCVEERISNRSRKCPTCNNKFSDKDVEDIWLS
jgi:E3 ubiquitin-protein ligase BRE1